MQKDFCNKIGTTWRQSAKMVAKILGGAKPSGMPVELSMSWPVLLNDICPMKLMIYGCVVRSNEKGAAVVNPR